LAWLTLLPLRTPLPVISQRRDIALNSSVHIQKARVMAAHTPHVKEVRA
jgi:hypothetical protein